MNQPPASITLTWCDRCGKTNRHNSLKAKHYERGTICSGRLFEVIYLTTGEVK